jgi:hypothetical protein
LCVRLVKFFAIFADVPGALQLLGVADKIRYSIPLFGANTKGLGVHSRVIFLYKVTGALGTSCNFLNKFGKVDDLIDICYIFVSAWNETSQHFNAPPPSVHLRLKFTHLWVHDNFIEILECSRSRIFSRFVFWTFPRFFWGRNRKPCFIS